jgi:hypothetical protein
MTRYDGPLPPNWKPRGPRQGKLIDDLVATAAKHAREGTYPNGRGPRGFFYDLRPVGPSGIRYVKHKDLPRDPTTGNPNDPTTWEPYYMGVSPDGTIYADPNAVKEALTYARRSGRIPEAAVADNRTGPQSHTLHFDEDAADDVERRIRWLLAAPDVELDPQAHEPHRVELWTESKDFSAKAAAVADEYGVPTYSGSGSTSIKLIRATAARIARSPVPIVVLQIGDCDKHGRSITAKFESDVRGWLTAPRPAGEGKPSSWLTVDRLALDLDQARRWDIADDDGNGEADGIPLDKLEGLIRNGCRKHLTREARQRWLTDQQHERAAVPYLLDRELVDLDDDLDDPEPTTDPLFDDEDGSATAVAGADEAFLDQHDEQS